MASDTLTVDRAFRALADPTRRVLLERMADRPHSVRELADPLPITLAAVVQHVQILEAAGLVETAKVGRVRTCRLRADGLETAEHWLADRRTTWERRLDRLGSVLDADAAAEDLR